MTNDEMNKLRQLAAKCLEEAFKGVTIPTHVAQAAVDVLNMPDPQPHQAPNRRSA